MNALCRDYLGVCAAAGLEPDAKLLAPIAEAFARLDTAEIPPEMET
jgi:hypothetical protein